VRYEYEVLQLARSEPGSLKIMLDEYGRSGWRVKFVNFGSGFQQIVLERERQK
jgi:hypothetical protein